MEESYTLYAGFIYMEEKGYNFAGIFSSMEKAQGHIFNYLKNRRREDTSPTMPYYVEVTMNKPPDKTLFIIQDPTLPPECVAVDNYDCRDSAWGQFAQTYFETGDDFSEIEFQIKRGIKGLSQDHYRLNYVKNNKKIMVYPWIMDVDVLMKTL